MMVVVDNVSVSMGMVMRVIIMRTGAMSCEGSVRMIRTAVVGRVGVDMPMRVGVRVRVRMAVGSPPLVAV